MVNWFGDWFLFYWGLMLLWVMGVGFEITSTVSGKRNEDLGLVQDFIFYFCVWYKSRESGDRVSPMFPCVTPVMEASPQNLCEL